jgi:hypothetical protein
VGSGDVVKVQAKSSWPPTRSVSICGSERYGTTGHPRPGLAMNAPGDVRGGADTGYAGVQLAGLALA